MWTDRLDYQVRVWNAFWNTWVSAPIVVANESEAVKMALSIVDYYDCGYNGTEEVQIYVKCLGMGTYQLIGYIEWDEGTDSWYMEPCFS